jgi:PIN domain
VAEQGEAVRLPARSCLPLEPVFGLAETNGRPPAQAFRRLRGMPAIGWLDGAVAAIEAVKPHVRDDGTLYWRDALLGWLQRTKPNESAIGRALRDRAIWRQAAETIRGQVPARSGVSFYEWLQEIEVRAEREHARRVGERHIVALIPDQELGYYGVDPAGLRVTVALMELGPEFPRNEIEGRWHGLVDANVIVQYQPLEQITWLQEVGAGSVTLWVTNSLLNELDGMKFYSDSPRVRDKARRFSSWLSDHLDQALRPAGEPIRQGVVLRVWAPAAASGSRDTDHLEAAFALLERAVPITIVTADTGLEARAKAAGVPVKKLQERWQLAPEPTPKEKETALRLRRAQLEDAPILTVQLRPEAGAQAQALSITNDSSGGEAKEVVVFFRPYGGQDTMVWNRTGNGHLPHDGENGYRAELPGALPPGSTDRLALIYYQQAPTDLDYEIRASREPPKKGRLTLTAGQYIEQQQQQQQQQQEAGPAPPA